MKRTLFFAAGFALSASIAASTVVFAQDAPMMSGVDVKAQLEDVENANALEFWPTIETDLETAIASVGADRISDEGYEVTVELKEISMSGASILGPEGEFNHMEGWVYFREQGNAVPVHQEMIVVDATTLDVGLQDGVVILPDTPAYYAGLLLGFSNATVDELSTLDGTDPDAETENRKANSGEDGGNGN